MYKKHIEETLYSTSSQMKNQAFYFSVNDEETLYLPFVNILYREYVNGSRRGEINRAYKTK